MLDSALVVIPARMASTRLPGKPLADICGLPMIIQVMHRAQEAAIGPVLIACCEQAVADAVTAAGGHAMMTDVDLPSGSDRVWQAVSRFDPEGTYQIIVNVQGDLPTLEPRLITASLAPLVDPAVDIATLVAEITDPEERTNPNVVKAVTGLVSATIDAGSASVARALYFTRATAPTGDGPLWHHIGLYAYRRAALQRFVGLAPSPLECREKLEQLRALENGMRIDCTRVDTVPLGVDTPADLEKARRILAAVSAS
jgi:3-deoxy-manno-octulosonate cytidylyltransferase (CMP-KDO synthetase)